jgi:protein-tyrosine phosphatase
MHPFLRAGIDATPIAPKLYQGSAPRLPHALRSAGFGTVVLCAHEIQPANALLLGIEVLRCPLDDNGSGPSLSEWRRATRTAAQVARRVRSRRRTLVTCAQGRNRSGLVVALALHDLYGWSGAACVGIVQRLREGALTNPGFVRALRSLPERSHAARTI